MMAPASSGASRERESGDRARFQAVVTGRVQGVGYRWFAQERAVAQGLGGTVRNLPNGSVEVEAEGPKAILETYLSELREGPPAARVTDVAVRWLPAQGVREFVIRSFRET